MQTFVVVLWFVACGVALLLLPLVWRMRPEQAARGGPLLRTAIVPKLASAIVFGVGFVLLPSTIGVALIVLAALLLGFALYVERSGRPRLLVPPALRAERVSDTS